AAGGNDDGDDDRADHGRGGGPWAGGVGRAGRAGAPGAAPRRVARLSGRVETVARAARRGAARRRPPQRREGGGRHGPPARSVRADLLRAAPPRRGELRRRRQHRAAGNRGRGGAGRGRGQAAAVAVNTAARAVALLACLAGCFSGTLATPPPAVAVMPFDPYGGAIYVPAIVNGDSAWLMFDTGLSRTGLDRDWAKSAGATPVADTGATVVLRSLRLGDLRLDDYRTALYPLAGLSEASGRLQHGLLGHAVLRRFAVEIDYPTRRVRLLDATSYRYAGPGTAVPFTPDADLPLLRARIKVRGRRAIPARLLLDTGASGLCLILTTPFVEQHGLA